MRAVLRHVYNRSSGKHGSGLCPVYQVLLFNPLVLPVLGLIFMVLFIGKTFLSSPLFLFLPKQGKMGTRSCQSGEAEEKRAHEQLRDNVSTIV